MAVPVTGDEPSVQENENGMLLVPVPTPRPSGPSARTLMAGSSWISPSELIPDPPFLRALPVNGVSLMPVPQIRQSVAPSAVRSWGFGFVASPLNPA